MTTNYRLSDFVSVSTVGREAMLVDGRTDQAHLISGPALEALEMVVAGKRPEAPEHLRALDHLVALQLVVAPENSSISRRRAIAHVGGAAALGVVTLALPAAQVAASYVGYQSALSTGGGFAPENLSPFSSSVRLPVLSGATAVRFTLYGAAGADSTKTYPADSWTGNYSIGEAGRGAVVQATFSISTLASAYGGSVAYFTCYVGTRGGGPLANMSMGQGTYATTSSGYNNGTNIGNAHATFWGGSTSNGNMDGGGGGAASLVYVNVPNASSLLMVAGGGGGGGAGMRDSFTTVTPQAGGAGGHGGRNGQPGGGTVGDGGTGTGGLGGYTSGDGGTPGAGGTGTGSAGSASSGTMGGTGGFTAGGGGGGWRGGGGGNGSTQVLNSSGAGGGGGSSWIRDVYATDQYYGTAATAAGGRLEVEWLAN